MTEHVKISKTRSQGEEQREKMNNDFKRWMERKV